MNSALSAEATSEVAECPATCPPRADKRGTSVGHARPGKPDWLPSHLPELDGLRGLAVLGVFFYHSHPRLTGTWLYGPARWGWSGVSLFFVLSGYLITSILLSAREQPRHYFRNFYARRGLRVWPLYVLLIAVCYLGPAWLMGQALPGVSKGRTLVVLLLFAQNLFHTKLVGALEPTWSLAIEEQYYIVWAPVVRIFRQRWVLASGLTALLAASPLIRFRYGRALNPTHTLLHLDCIALGSLLGLALLSLRWTRRTWLQAGIASAVCGFGAAATVAGGTAFADSALGLGFAGVVLTAIAGTGARNPVAWLLRRGPLPFYGRISYGLYLTHMSIFISLGVVYLLVDGSGIGGSCWGNLTVVAIQFIVCTAVATLLWHGLEKRILRLKKHFPSGS